jgi:hypothetical protein
MLAKKNHNMSCQSDVASAVIPRKLPFLCHRNIFFNILNGMLLYEHNGSLQVKILTADFQKIWI